MELWRINQLNHLRWPSIRQHWSLGYSAPLGFCNSDLGWKYNLAEVIKTGKVRLKNSDHSFIGIIINRLNDLG